MADASVETSSCYNLLCGTIVEGTVAQCPKCGRRMKSAASVRRLGWLLAVIGVFLAGMMAYIMKEIGPALTETAADVKLPGTQGEFTGTPSEAADTLRLFWVLIGYGALNVVNGVYQIVTGRRSRVMTVIIFAGALAIVVLGYQLYQDLGGVAA